MLNVNLRALFPLVIVGGKGWGNVNVQAMVSRFGIEDQVIIAGNVSDTELATLYQHAEVLCMPSIFEGFGLPIAEAMSYGTPVITSNVSSMPEVAGNAGLLVNPFDERAIFDALMQILTKKHVRMRLAKNASKMAGKFRWDQAANQLWDLCEKERK